MQTIDNINPQVRNAAMLGARRPDFIIVGAPKCGTTALYSYLAQHPDIFLPAQKEVHFFGSDLGSPTYIRNEAEYLSLFAKAGAGQRVGEASVWYLYSRSAASEIHAYIPDVKIVMMLRNPVDMMYSLHSEQYYNGYEPSEDFMTALGLEESRKAALASGRQPQTVALTLYKDAATYSAQVKRYLDTFPRENVHIILYDDLKRDAGKVYQEVLAFLGLASYSLADFKVVNANKSAASIDLNRWLLQPTPLLRKLARALVPSRNARHRLIGFFKFFNTAQKPRPPLSPTQRHELGQAFVEDIHQLSALINRDLSHWLAG